MKTALGILEVLLVIVGMVALFLGRADVAAYDMAVAIWVHIRN